MKFLCMLLCIFFLTGCSGNTAESPVTTAAAETLAKTEDSTSAAESLTETLPPDPIGNLIDDMSLEERVGQLILARCDDASAIAHIQQYHLGGFVLFGLDFDGQTPDSMVRKLSDYQNAAKIPLLIAVDEEGGTVTRVSRVPAFRSSKFPSARDSYSAGGLDRALQIEEEKCILLSSLGINVNLGPVCDISTEPGAFMYQRSLGQDPHVTADFTGATVRLMRGYRIGSVLKHFPGYGNNTDTHTGIAVDSRSLESLEQNDLVPFAAGFQAGCGAVLVSHTIVQALDSELPASLSPAVHGYLRENMGFNGVIITDDLVMQAITDQYGAGEAAVMAVLAGNDSLCSTDYVTQYEAVLGAVQSGRIEISVLNKAVRNVLEWKMDLGLL